MAGEKNAVAVKGEVVAESVDISHAREVVALRSQELQLDKAAHKQLLEQAQLFFDAKALPANIKNAPQVYMMLKAGKERGLSEVESLNSFYFVNGKLAMYGPAVIAQVIRAGHVVKWGECSAKEATVEIIRGNDKDVSLKDTLTYEEAKAAGGTTAVWKTHTRNMLKYRVFRMVASFVCPDALQGVSVESDTSLVLNQDGRVIDVEDDGVMNQSEITAWYNDMVKAKGYAADFVNEGMLAVLGRDSLTGMTKDEATKIEKWLCDKSTEQTSTGQEGDSYGG